MTVGSFQFGEFELDCERFELRRGLQAVRMERKPLELLILLASAGGRLVTREEIARRLWPAEVFVDTEHGINTAISKIRYALREDSDHPRFLQTVTGKGYRLTGATPKPQTAPTPSAGFGPDWGGNKLDRETSLSAIVSSPRVAKPAVAPDSETTLSLIEGAAATTSGVPGSIRVVWLTVWFCASALTALAFLTIGARRVRGHSITPQSVHQQQQEIRYEQLTDFTDSAVAPALSPDGRMVAFIRGNNWFLSSDPIYAKMLPNGEAKRITDDNRLKYGLTFSPDGSEIAYTVFSGSGFSTYEVSALGGEPHLLLENAAGPIWLDAQRLLFSEIRPLSGVHMGVVTATETRGDEKDIYFPAHERGMAHYSYPSPDRRWALVVEMTGSGEWGQCQLIALAGQRGSQAVGPVGKCTSAGWSEDGRWMYFSESVAGESHIWRQAFPGGQPEQITRGPMEEDGVAMEPSGRALITSVGQHESAIWMHDGREERQLSSEGEVIGDPVFSSDGSVVYYLLRRGDGSGAELWRTTVGSGKSEALLPDTSMTAFDVSRDGKEVVYTADAIDRTTHLWLAALDGSRPATQVNIRDARLPQFGTPGHILFQRAVGNLNYLEQIDEDSSNHRRVFPFPIVQYQGVSPSRRWVVVIAPLSQTKPPGVMAIPLAGGNPQLLCSQFCRASWTTDGKFLFVSIVPGARNDPGRTLTIPLGPGEILPEASADGRALIEEPRVVPRSESIARAKVVAGKDREHYAWVNMTVHRNLYRILLP